jgi:hypothetical protein
MNTPTVDEAVDNLRRALRAEQTQAIVKHLEAVLSIGQRSNGHAKPHRKMSPAGRARQVAAMKAYWRKRRAQKK